MELFDNDGNSIPVYGVSELLLDVNSLRASGGGDCPEYGMIGIQKALQLLEAVGMKSKPFRNGKHNIIVLTDASAKDGNLRQSIISYFETSDYDITVHNFFSGTGCGAAIAFGNYAALADATGGFVVSEINAQSFPTFVEFVRASTTSKRSTSFCESFIVSQFVRNFTILIITEDTAVNLAIPDGTTVTLYTEGRSFIIYSVSDPLVGEWRACASDTTIELTVNFVVALDFTVSYLEKDSEGQLLPTFRLPSLCKFVS